MEEYMIGYAMAGTAALGLWQAAQQREYQGKAYIAGIESQISQMNLATNMYTAQVDALMLEQEANERMAEDALMEAYRANSSTLREAQVEVDKGRGTLLAQSDSITGGTSKARQMASYYVNSSKALGKVQDEGVKVVTSIAKNLEQANLSIHNREQNSYNQLMQSLATGSVAPMQPQASASTYVMAGLQGAATGAQIYTALQ